MRLYISRDRGKMLEMLKLQSGPVPKQEVASWPWWHFLKVCFGISVLHSGKKFYKEARQYKLCCISFEGMIYSTCNLNLYVIIPKGVYQNLNIHKDTLFILKWTKTNISFYIYWLSSPDINCLFCYVLVSLHISAIFSVILRWLCGNNSSS